MNIFKFLTNRKYRFFKRKIKDVRAMIWEIEFKIAKSRQIREGVRQDRDRAVELMNMLTNALKDEKLEAEQKKKLEEQLAKATDNKTRYERQMEMIDDEINGIEPTAEREGQPGLIERVKGFTELEVMYREYSKTC